MAQKVDSKPTTDELLKEFERKLDRLRFQYEQYFLGIDKMEPLQLKKDVFRLQHALEQESMSTAASRFRFRSLCQRYNSYKSYWARTIRQIELGTYPRAVARLEREMRKKGVKIEGLRGAKNMAQIEAAMRRAAERREEPSPAKVTDRAADAALRTKKAPRPAAAPAPGGMSAGEAAELHRNYAEARRKCGQASDVDYATFMATLRQRADAIRSKYGVEQIRFQVAIKNGRPILQATPKK